MSIGTSVPSLTFKPRCRAIEFSHCRLAPPRCSMRLTSLATARATSPRDGIAISSHGGHERHAPATAAEQRWQQTPERALR